MNIKFENISHSAERRNFCRKNDVKPILKEINGEFRFRELSAIIGASGCGKTTLLNILSGYISNNFTGQIKVNGHSEASQKIIREKSSYIMQENTLHKFLTVHETMKFAVNLKLGKRLQAEQRDKKILEILESLGLNEVIHHQIKDLSGGEQKRLAIAIELVDDPSILFLDEPTTGLDSSSSTQCIRLLKKLADEGKTIICTIHSPSALLFEMFDHIYALADGCCIYQGSCKSLVPFLAELDLVCPEIYSPSDFLLEIATNDYGPQNSRLTEKIQNGTEAKFRKSNQLEVEEDLNLDVQLDKKSLEFPTSFCQQFGVLLYRNLLTNLRDKTLMLMRLSINLAVGICFGTIYFGIGDEASNIFDIQRFVVYSLYHPMFVGFNSQLTTFAVDLPMTKREIFNGWYSPGAYYLALTVVDIPALILNNLLFVSITYFMTNQPMELFRIGLFFTTSVLVAFTSQGLGILSGSLASIQYALVIAAFFIFIFTTFSGFFVLMKDTSYGWHWLFYSSFMKHALDCGFLAIFGFDRTKLKCEAVYCHYRWPHKFLESLGVDATWTNSLTVLVISLFVFRITAFFVIKFRLRH